VFKEALETATLGQHFQPTQMTTTHRRTKVCDVACSHCFNIARMLHVAARAMRSAALRRGAIGAAAVAASTIIARPIVRAASTAAPPAPVASPATEAPAKPAVPVFSTIRSVVLYGERVCQGANSTQRGSAHKLPSPPPPVCSVRDVPLLQHRARVPRLRAHPLHGRGGQPAHQVGDRESWDAASPGSRCLRRGPIDATLSTITLVSAR